MLSLPLFTLGLAAIGAYAKPTARAAGGLEVSISTPTDNVPSISDLRIVATVKNTGDKDLKIIKFGTVLDNENHARSFVVSKDGKEVPFAGTEVPAPTDQVSENNWVVIHSGESVTTEHDAASALYDFSASGPGIFTFDPVSKFRVIGPNNTTRIEIANTNSIYVTIAHVSKRELKLEKRGQRIDCDNSEHSISIALGVLEARNMASAAVSYIKKYHNNDNYKGIFKSIPTDEAISAYTKVVNSNTASMVLNCSDPQERCQRPDDGPQYAYTIKQNIYICDRFYKLFSLSSFCAEGSTLDSRQARVFHTLFYLAQAVGETNGNELKYALFGAEVMKLNKCKLDG